MRESEHNELQARRRAAGRPLDDSGRFSAWREQAQPENLHLLDFYGRYLVGQYVGLGKALSLHAVKAALEIEDIDRQGWPEMTERLLLLHGYVLEHLPKE